MPKFEVPGLLGVVGALLLLLALAQQLMHGRLTTAGRTWWRIGVIFIGVAAWLCWQGLCR